LLLVPLAVAAAEEQEDDAATRSLASAPLVHFSTSTQSQIPLRLTPAAVAVPVTVGFLTMAQSLRKSLKQPSSYSLPPQKATADGIAGISTTLISIGTWSTLGRSLLPQIGTNFINQQAVVKL
jgi:hypothetical protein